MKCVILWIARDTGEAVVAAESADLDIQALSDPDKIMAFRQAPTATEALEAVCRELISASADAESEALKREAN